jgi:hypothetical protein
LSLQEWEIPALEIPWVVTIVTTISAFGTFILTIVKPIIFTPVSNFVTLSYNKAMEMPQINSLKSVLIVLDSRLQLSIATFFSTVTLPKGLGHTNSGKNKSA